MTFEEYQRRARETAIYPPWCVVIYPALGLAGESGEVAEKVKKCIRDNQGLWTEDRVKTMVKEMGDVLWYIAALCHDLGVSMEEVAKTNLKKLAERKEKDLLHGEGDHREEVLS